MNWRDWKRNPIDLGGHWAIFMYIEGHPGRRVICLMCKKCRAHSHCNVRRINVNNKSCPVCGNHPPEEILKTYKMYCLIEKVEL